MHWRKAAAGQGATLIQWISITGQVVVHAAIYGRALLRFAACVDRERSQD